jgi:hypothetical protein
MYVCIYILIYSYIYMHVFIFLNIYIYRAVPSGVGGLFVYQRLVFIHQLWFKKIGKQNLGTEMFAYIHTYVYIYMYIYICK